MNQDKIYLAGDHNAGLHPKVVEAIQTANNGKAASYGGDEETAKMRDNFNKLFGTNTKVLMFNGGTAANICAIASVTKPYNSIICAQCAHINTYEAGGPTRFSGCVLEALPTKDGKISIKQIQEILEKRPKEADFSQPRVVYITQPTEYGVLWTLEELKTLTAFCKEKNLLVFMDGARLANALASLNLTVKEMTTDIGIDLLTWGGIKNGGLADALIFLNDKISQDSDFVFKQLGQMVAKARFYSATINALLKDNLWLDNAKHANQMALKLSEVFEKKPEIKIVLPVQTNFVWSIMPESLNQKLNEKFVYYMESNDLDVEEYKNIPFFSRFVTSWATSEEEIEQVAKHLTP